MEKLKVYGKITLNDIESNFYLFGNVLEIDVFFDITKAHTLDLENLKGKTSDGMDIYFIDCRINDLLSGKKNFNPRAVLISKPNAVFNRISFSGGSLNKLIEPIEAMFEVAKGYDHENGEAIIKLKNWDKTDILFNYAYDGFDIKTRIGVPRQLKLSEKNLLNSKSYLRFEFKEDQNHFDLSKFINQGINVISYLNQNSEEIWFDEISVSSDDETGIYPFEKFIVYVNYRPNKVSKLPLLEPKDFLVENNPDKLKFYIEFMDLLDIEKELVFGYEFFKPEKSHLLNSIIVFERLWGFYERKYQLELRHDIEDILKDFIVLSVNKLEEFPQGRFRDSLKSNLSKCGSYSLKDKIICLVEEFGLLSEFISFEFIKNKDKSAFNKELCRVVDFRNSYAHGSTNNKIFFSSGKSYLSIIFINFYMIFYLSGYSEEESVILLRKIYNNIRFKKI